MRATVALAQTACLQHWALDIASDMPRGLFDKLDVQRVVTCEVGAQYDAGYTMSELVDTSFSFVPVREWAAVGAGAGAAAGAAERSAAAPLTRQA